MELQLQKQFPNLPSWAGAQISRPGIQDFQPPWDDTDEPEVPKSRNLAGTALEARPQCQPGCPIHA